MGWLIVGFVAAVCVIAVIGFAMRWDPTPVDYPSENGDGEDRC